MKKRITTLFFCAICAIDAEAQNIDSSFTTNGYLPYGGPLSNNSQNAYGGNNMVRQSDGKLVVAEDYTNGNATDNYFYTYRYNADGTPDASFGTNGVSAIFCGASSDNRDLQLQPDGKIVITGATEYCILGVCGALQFVTMRLKTNGDLDSTFGHNGKLITVDIFGTTGLFALPKTLKILPDGKFIVGGKGPGGYPFVARLKSNGLPDSTFATNGVYTDSVVRTTFKDLAINNDGDILVLLEKYNYITGTGADTTNLLDNYIFKLKKSGSRDNTFGTSGRLVFSGSNSEHPQSIAVKNNQSIVVVGDEQYNNTENNNWNGTGTNGYGITNKGYIAFVKPNGTMAAYISGSYKSIRIPGDTSTFIQKVVVLNDNRLFVSGKVITVVSGNYQEKAFLCQIDSLGNYISDFNTHGYWIFDYGVVGSGWQGKLCAINDIDVTTSNEVYATGYRNHTAGNSGLSLFLIKLKNVVTGNVPTKVSTISNNVIFSLYPNPAGDNLSLESSSTSAYTVYSIDGKIICIGNLEDGRNNIQLPASMNSGIYFIVDNQTKQALKFIKK